MSNECKKFTGAELKIGMTAERSKTITKKDIEYFGIVSTDTNPMHFDEDYASKTQFGRCIAHGVISLSLCGSVLGMELTFKKPVYPGDTITAHCEIIDIQYKEKKDFYIVKVKQWVTNQNGDVVTEGIATCMPPKA